VHIKNIEKLKNFGEAVVVDSVALADVKELISGGMFIANTAINDELKSGIWSEQEAKSIAWSATDILRSAIKRLEEAQTSEEQ